MVHFPTRPDRPRQRLELLLVLMLMLVLVQMLLVVQILSYCLVLDSPSWKKTTKRSSRRR